MKILNSGLDLNQLLELFGQEIEKLEEFDGYVIALLDEKKENLVWEKLSLPREYKQIEQTYLHSKFNLSLTEASVSSFKENKILKVFKNESNNFGDITRSRFDLWRIMQAVYIPLIQFEGNQKLIYSSFMAKDSIGNIFLFRQNGEVSEKKIIELMGIISLFYEQLKNIYFYSNLKKQEQNILAEIEKSAKVLETADYINNLTSLDLIYKTILEKIVTFFKFEYGMLFMEKNNNLDYIFSYTTKNDLVNSLVKIDKFYKSAHGYALSVKEGANTVAFLKNIHYYFPDVQTIKHLPMSEKDKYFVNNINTRTFVTMPIRKNNNPIGILNIGSVTDKVVVEEKDLKLLESLCSFIGTAIANAELYTLVGDQKKLLEEHFIKLDEQNKIIKQKNKQLMEDLSLAKQIQQNLIPVKNPEINGIRLSTFYKPMDQVGGDFYDFIEIPNSSSFGIFISDVSGHGVAAALITSMIKALIGTAETNIYSPKNLLSFINEKIIGKTIGNFLTAFYAIYDEKSKILSYARAAHNFPFLIRENQIIELKSKGNMLGLYQAIYFEEIKIQLYKNDKILFYTDGLVETINPLGVYFLDILPSILLANKALSIEEFIQKIYYNLIQHRENYTFEDDICMIGMEII